MSDVNLLLAFAAGVLGFLSPCIVPLIPGYLSFVSGLSLSELPPAGRRQHRAQVVVGTVVFVVGFAIVFTALGASATVLGNIVLRNRVWLGRIGGAVIIMLGLSLWGILRIPALFRERRVRVPRPRTVWGVLAVGMAFGFAWTPCIGPVLAAILTLAATSTRAADGAILLLGYSLGLGVPFVMTAVLLTGAVDSLAWVRRHGRLIGTASGAFLVAMGAALMFDLIFRLNTLILRLFPFRPAI